MLTKEISGVEKGCEDGWYDFNQDVKCAGLLLCPICQAKLSTLKSAQAKFDSFVEDLKEKIEDAQEDYGNLDWVSKEQAIKIIDELSSKQEKIK